MLSASSDLTRPAFFPDRIISGSNLNGPFLPSRLRGRKRNLFGLAPGGVYQATPIARGTGELLPHLFTFIPTFDLYTMRCRAFVGTVFFLWHFPYPCLNFKQTQSALRTTLPCGARTFLPSVPPFFARCYEGATISSPSIPPFSLALISPLKCLILQMITIPYNTVYPPLLQ